MGLIKLLKIWMSNNKTNKSYRQGIHDSIYEIKQTKKRILEKFMEKKKSLYKELVSNRIIRDEKYSRMSITIFYIYRIREIKDLEKIITEEFGGENEKSERKY